MKPLPLDSNGTTTASTILHTSITSRSAQITRIVASSDFFSPAFGNSLYDTSAPSPTCKQNCSCVDPCFVFPPPVVKVNWVPYKPFSTVTAATLFHVVHNDTNHTTTSMKHNTLPNGLKPQDLNAGGTTQATITYSLDSNTITTTVLYRISPSF